MAWLRKIEEYLVYPAAWTLDPAPTPWATLSMTLVPPDDEIGTRIVFLLADRLLVLVLRLQ
ncbi:MAG: hypothetical protein J0M17_12435 [Planctomycetes bacterium]|nr:hypothetical protein [Planctomycetota bacterium]